MLELTITFEVFFFLNLGFYHNFIIKIHLKQLIEKNAIKLFLILTFKQCDIIEYFYAQT